ncbi:MAG: hypothetical protein AAFU53_06660, partial [Cyanobacteria bacterium J06632_3]
MVIFAVVIFAVDLRRLREVVCLVFGHAMKVLHGTWIPDAQPSFVQSGAFYLWVETAATSPPAVSSLQATSSKAASSKAASRSDSAKKQRASSQKKSQKQSQQQAERSLHPQHLSQTSLARFLQTELGFPSSSRYDISKEIGPKFFQLPTANGSPLPSPEISRYLEQEIADSWDWQTWQIDCYRVGHYFKGNQHATGIS